ncbi:MAG: hypothetical protein PQJ61_02370 [Spirochaetales bacterium]|uniref:Uncharacterized protein n=1 Tax=Candidatus Thalassospirochaeta sargassi TaxID=3119039 RepID=A0AAJ1MLB5_9SPIO|nr:hypothetical protein [Spirochaetales bacterium]
MTNIVVFTNEETEFIQSVLESIKQKKPDEADYIVKRMMSLQELANTVSSYPSFQSTRTIGNSTFSMESLIEMICRMDFADQVMYVPTKVILGRSYVVAKINFLLMLKYESESIRKLKKHAPRIEELVTMNIFALMSEEVYLSLIQEKDIELEIKTRAAVRLMNIWEYRLSQSAEDYAPMLSSLWKSRKHLTPIYGTMMGMTEMLQMAKNINPVWFDFIGSSENDDGVFEALEEFLFNLTYEELLQIRESMKKNNIACINKKNIESLLHIEHFYSTFQAADPREMLRFFKQRKKNAVYRERSRTPGPVKTIEEYILLFMLKKELQ